MLWREANNINNKLLYKIFAVVGFIFLKSGFEKITGGKFVDSLAGTLAKFAKDNPYPPVKSFLENIAIPNSLVFAYLTQWGEFLAGLNLLVLSLWMIFSPKSGEKFARLLTLGFGTGLLLNIVFWFSAGYTSSSTGSLNLLMGAVNLVGLIFVSGKSKNS